MNTSEYLDACKKALNIQSDYELAARMDTSRTNISRYRSGESWPDDYACAKMGVILNLDPMQILADLHTQREKNPKKAEFWKGFLSRTSSHASRTLAWALIAGFIAGAGVLGSSLDASRVFFRRRCYA